MRFRLLGQYIPAPIVVRAVIEITLLFYILYGAAAMRLHHDVASIERTEGPLWPRALLFSVVTFACQLAFGLHSARQRARSAGIFIRIVAAACVGTVITGVGF